MLDAVPAPAQVKKITCCRILELGISGIFFFFGFRTPARIFQEAVVVGGAVVPRRRNTDVARAVT